jgi:hypothetical protein
MGGVDEIGRGELGEGLLFDVEIGGRMRLG